MAIEIVDFPIKNGDFPVRYVKLPEDNWGKPLKQVATIINHLASKLIQHKHVSTNV
jgi:hypothetical protein